VVVHTLLSAISEFVAFASVKWQTKGYSQALESLLGNFTKVKLLIVRY
jgi:hypothetical protein